MRIALALAELLTAACVIATFLLLIVLPVLHERYTPKGLLGLQMRLRGIFAQHPQRRASAADQRIESEHYEHVAMLYPEADPITLLELSMAEEKEAQAAQVTLLARWEEPAELSLLLSEIDLYLGFVPLLTRRAIHVTPTELDKLAEFCAFRYDTIRTPKEVFAEYGIRIVHRSRKDARLDRPGLPSFLAKLMLDWGHG